MKKLMQVQIPVTVNLEILDLVVAVSKMKNNRSLVFFYETTVEVIKRTMCL